MTAADDDVLDIRAGGIVSVDTASLRAARSGLLVIADACERVRGTLDGVRRILATVGVWFFPPAGAAASTADRCRRLAGDLQSMADAYELAELSAAAAVAMAAGDAALAAVLRDRGRAILAADPAAPLRLAAAAVDGRTEVAAALAAQYRAPVLPGGFSPWSAEVLAWMGVGMVGALCLGAVPRDARLAGRAVPVDLRPLGAARTTAPASLAQIVDRIPHGDARVRVERYTMPGGAREFVVYSAGTHGGGRREAWDAESNLALYTRSQGASYAATLAAATAAGALPGDRVTLAGYSQGAMVASFLALSGEYEVPLLVTFGDPVQADVGDTTLSVAVRHLDDPVSALADGGHDAGVGAEGSFVASRASPGTAFTGEGMLGPHDLAAYRDTARLLDSSADPRMDAVRAHLGQLAGATSVEAFAYGASRLEEMSVQAPGVRGGREGATVAGALGVDGVLGVPRVPGVSEVPGVPGATGAVTSGGDAASTADAG